MLLIASSETTLKSSPVRNFLERRVAKHLRIIFSRHGEKPLITRENGRIVVRDISDMSEGLTLASKVFGVASVMRASQVGNDMDTIVHQSVTLGLQKIMPNSTFAVKARRLGTHSFTSKDLENVIGSKILERLADRGVSVDLKRPDTTVYVEVREDCTYVYTERVAGPGGLPYGCQGSVVSLFSGSLDSRLSTWLLMKRGARIIPVYCDEEDDTPRDKVLRWLKQIYSILPVRKPSFIVVPFKDVLGGIYDSTPKDVIPIIRMHSMLIIADCIAQEMKAIGIVTGESLGDSGSMDTIVQASSDLNAPIYRPLVGFERNEIVELAKKASLYDESEYKTTPEVQRVSMQSFVNPIQNIRTQLETALTKKEIVPIAPMPYDE